MQLTPDPLPATRRTWHITLLIFLSTLLWVLPSGLWDLRGPDEGRYVQIAKEINASGEWLALTVHGEPYDQKPPLMFWFLTLMLKLAGGEVVSGLLRLPSALAAMGGVVMVYLMAARHWGARAGLLAGLILMASPTFVDDGPTVELNMLFTGFITLSLFAWINRPTSDQMPIWRVVLFWAALAAAFFVKGPVAFIVVWSALLWEAFTTKAWRRLRLLWPVLGWALVLALIGGWFLAQKQRFGGEFVQQQIESETVKRLLKGSHREPFWYYFPRIFTSMFTPWAFILVPACIALWRMRGKLTPPLHALVGWLLFPFLLFCLASGKRQSYLLPLFPAAAMMVGWYLDKHLADRPVRTWARWAVAALGGVICLGLVAVTAWFARDPALVDVMPMDVRGYYFVVWTIAAITSAALAVYAARKMPRVGHAVYTTVALMLLVVLVDFTTARKLMDPTKSARALGEHVDTLLTQRKETRVGSIDDLLDAEYHTYGHYLVTRLRPGKTDPAASTQPNIILLEDKRAVHMADWLQRGGYRPETTMTITKMPVVIFTRYGAPGSTTPR